MGRKVTLLVFILCIACLQGFTQKNTQSPADPRLIQLRPNSREYVAVRRTNLHQRMDMKIRKAQMQAARAMWMSQKLQMRKAVRNNQQARIAHRNNRAVIEQQKMMMRQRKRR